MEHAALVQRDSGVIVPARLAHAAEAVVTVTKNTDGTTRDMDGRLRIVFTDDERRQVNRTLALLRREGLGFIVGCVRPGGCGEPMRAEGADTNDPGHGCSCTRVHYLRK